MASNRKIVMKRGTLRGMGFEAECLVTATEVSLPNSGLPPEYARMSIHRVSIGNLPDGPYEVSFDGRWERVQKRGDGWYAPR